MDAKYGRLFTETDMCAIVSGVLSAHGLNPETARHDAAGALRAMDQSTTFPADEPLFLLRGQDEAAPNAIAAPTEAEQEYGGIGDYCSGAMVAGAEDEYLATVFVAARAMREWQAANPDRVKVPD